MKGTLDKLYSEAIAIRYLIYRILYYSITTVTCGQVKWQIPRIFKIP